MLFVSWNVNGFRAVLKKGFDAFFSEIDADIFCIQESKMQPDQADYTPKGYHQYWNSAVRKGYSGTAIFTKKEPISVSYHLGFDDKHNDEGRAITAEYDDFYLVNVYTPNAQSGLNRIDYRMQWEDDLRDYLIALDAKKPVIYCGDLNVAHNEIDLKNPGPNRGQAGFSDEERGKMNELLSCGFTDTFRALYPDKTGAYSWWSYRGNARANNTGWRIDYWIVSNRLMSNVQDSMIYADITGSDHCPVGLSFG